MKESEKSAFNIPENIKENLKDIKNITMVMSGKGGVGKSTIAANLGIALSQKNLKVGLLDIDIHGPNLPKILGVDKKRMSSMDNKIEPVKIDENLKMASMAFLLENESQAIIWRGPLKMKIINQFLGDTTWDSPDWLVVDAPPGTGDEPLSLAQMVPATSAIIVTTPQELSILDVRKSVTFAEKLNLRILGIIENMSGFVCPECGARIDLFKEGGGEKVAEELGIDFLGRIPVDPEIVKSSDEGEFFVKNHPESKASIAINEIVEKIITKTE